MILIFFLSLAALLLLLLALADYSTAINITIALLPTYLLRVSVFGLPTNFFEIAVGILCIAGLLRSDIRRAWRLHLARLERPFVYAALLFLVAAIISTFISPQVRVSLGILKGWVVIPLLFAFICSVKSWEPDGLWRRLHPLILSGTAVAFGGLFQLGYVSRIHFLYDVPNSLALFLAPIFVLGVWQYFHLPSQKMTSLLSLIIIGAAVVGTQSVMALVSVVVSLTLGVIMWRPLKRKRIGLAVAAMAVIALAILGSTGRIQYFLQPFFSSAAHSSLSVRFQLWSVAAGLIREHPLLGIGLGQFEPNYQQKLHERFAEYSLQSTYVPSDCVPPDAMKHCLPPPLSEFVFRDPHNWLLSFWLNTGLLGLLSFIAIHYFIFKSVKSDPSPGAHDDTIRQAIILALLSLLIFGLADTIYWKNDLSALHWLFIWLLAASL